MKISKRGLDLIKSFEGLSLRAVRLPGEDFYTIGYGHYGADVSPTQRMTVPEAEALLRKDVAQHEGWVNAAIARSQMGRANQNQFDALVSFSYNCGPGWLQTLTVARTAAEIAGHWMQYTASSSEAYRQGLTNRRRKELALFLEPCTKDKEEIEMTKEELLTLDGTGDEHSSGSGVSEAIAWAKENKIFVGDGKGNFGWKQPITREAVAILLYKLLGQEGGTK